MEVLEITKLAEESGDQTVSVAAFEGNNLVLVDEGHRGTSLGAAGTWLGFRDRLCRDGFSFEYSATFGQAVESETRSRTQGLSLRHRYARSILIDYSYRYFHADGYGKEYDILNLGEGADEGSTQLYLTGCLLSFFQQLLFFQEQAKDLIPYRIAKPLLVFVGASVNAVRRINKEEVSDVVEILQFLDRYASDKTEAIRRIDDLLTKGLTTSSGHNVFADSFAFLLDRELTADVIYRRSLQLLFNAPAGGRIHLENLNGVDGEIAVRIGMDSRPFGVINVGDESKLLRLCENHGLVEGDREFAGSLFEGLKEHGSPVNVLIGSKKFSEGWSSWRVSTMGLMNVGKSEGTQIIQLFGRGVRLEGYSGSLKRSSRLTDRSTHEETSVSTTSSARLARLRASRTRRLSENGSGSTLKLCRRTMRKHRYSSMELMS